jgi:hypothetical protein
MIDQLEYLKSFVIGDSKALSPPKWLLSEGWTHYTKCVIMASESVEERLRDRLEPCLATPEVVQATPKMGTKIGLRTKLHFVSTPEEL